MPYTAHETSLLRHERIQHSWRQRDVAEHLGTTILTVNRWERGIQRPSAYYRLKLCALFGKNAEELGLVDDYAPQPTAPQHGRPALASISTSFPKEDALWTIPYLRNLHFTGRDALLDQLTQRLFTEERGDPMTTRCVALTQAQAITGLGGIGKTQIAVEYAYRAAEQKHYTSTIWINAASEETILTSFVALAHMLPALVLTSETDQRQLVMAIKRWLEHCQQRWLLIFDNADDVASLQPYLPQRGNGHLLFTTRSHAVGSFAACINVEVMSLVEGIELLLCRAQRPHISDEERNEAANIVIALDGLPLALDQAGAYLEETGCSFRDYLQIYQEHHQALLARRGKQATNYPNSVATTWSLSFQKVERTNPAAADLLRLCAFLAPDHIPEELLTDGAAHWPSLLQHTVTDLFAFDQMLEELLKFSLVKRLAEDKLLSVHRLVQVVQRDCMEHKEQRDWTIRIVRAMQAAFPCDPKEEAGTWPQCLRYLEQVQACDTLIQQHVLLIPEAADLLNRAGTYLRVHAFYTQAEAFYQRALSIWEQAGASNHPEMIQLLGNLALLSYQQANYRQAEALYRRALRACEQEEGLIHPVMPSLLSELAHLYMEQASYERAEALLQQALFLKEQMPNVNPLDTAKVLSELAILYAEQREAYEQGEPLLQHALHLREQILGPDHPHVASALHNVAEVCRKQGKYKQAEALFQRAVCIWERTLGPSHPFLTRPLQGLAQVCSSLGRYKQAELLYQRALSIWEQTLAPEQLHLDAAEVLHNFATLHDIWGNCQEALLLYRRAFAIRVQLLGLHHIKTTETGECLRAVLVAQGQTEEVMQLNLGLCCKK